MTDSPPETKTCSYVYRQGKKVGTPCHNLVTKRDNLKQYCCHHYKLKSTTSPPAAVIQCSYMRRNGKNAGVQCERKITEVDPEKRYCCSHYAILTGKNAAKVEQSRIEELTAELEKLKAGLN